MPTCGIIFTPNFVHQSVYLEVYTRRYTHPHTHTQRSRRFLTLNLHLYGEKYASQSVLSTVYCSIKSKYTVYVHVLGFRHKDKVRHEHNLRH